MARPRSLKPKYMLHKASGRACVIVDGKTHYLGRHGSQESIDQYDRLIGEWIARGRPRGVEPDAGDNGPLTVNQVIAGFWAFAVATYPDPLKRPEGRQPGGELGNYWSVLRPLRRLYGETPAADFGPLRLKALRDQMTRPHTAKDEVTGEVRKELGWCRNTANRQMSRIKRVFKWAVESELLPGEVYSRLSAVSGLQRGRSSARETEPVRPAPEAYVEAAIAYLHRRLQAMVRIQLLTGMRPGEVCAMKTGEIEMAGDVWVYRPASHKTAHHGHTREISIGPEARKVLAPFLKTDLQAFIFSPAEAEAERLEEKRRARTTPRRPWEHRVDKAAVDARGGRRRPPGERYSTKNYRQAIERAIARAHAAAEKEGRAVHGWTPNQLRHTAATLIRRLYGLEASRVVLGHRSAATTEIYAEIDLAKSREIMARIG